MLYVSRARFVLYAGSGGNCTYAMNSTYGGVVQIDQGGVYFLPLRLMAPAVYTLCHVFAQQFHFEVCRMTPQMPPPARPPMPPAAEPSASSPGALQQRHMVTSPAVMTYGREA